MTDEEKVILIDYIIRYLEEIQVSSEIPVLVGSLNSPQGINGFKPAVVGHPVFMLKDRYIIYLESNDGKTTVSIPYYKEALNKVINFN